VIAGGPANARSHPEDWRVHQPRKYSTCHDLAPRHAAKLRDTTPGCQNEIPWIHSGQTLSENGRNPERMSKSLFLSLSLNALILCSSLPATSQDASPNNPPPYCNPCLFYGGDFDPHNANANALANELTTSVVSGARVFIPFCRSRRQDMDGDSPLLEQSLQRGRNRSPGGSVVHLEGDESRQRWKGSRGRQRARHVHRYRPTWLREKRIHVDVNHRSSGHAEGWFVLDDCRTRMQNSGRPCLRRCLLLRI
jgi:hypothetical protein